MVALCPGNNEVHIYTGCQNPDTSAWERVDILTEHQMTISAIDWSPVTNKIVTCSHDRNAFVWSYDDETSKWMPSLVILRINRAALDVKWSPNGEKFAVASGSKCVPVCHFDTAGNWWISKMIKKHKSTVLTIAWHPDGQLLLTGCADFKCRIFSAFIGGEDEPIDGLFGNLTDSFADLLADFDTSLGWVESVAWSPSGRACAFAGHDSSLSIVTFNGNPTEEAPTVQCIKSSGKPMLTIQFLTDQLIVGAGHEFNPTLHASLDGFWTEVGKVDKKGAVAAATSSSFGNARSMFGNMARTGARNADASVWTKHDNTIVQIQRYAPFGEPSPKFTSCGIDGRLITWDVTSSDVPADKLPGL